MTPAKTDETLSIPEKLDRLEHVTNGVVLERTAEIRCAINAMLSGRHMCMIGEPGIAKSFLTRTMVRLIGDIADGEYFEWFVTKFSTPEELLGPHSLKALEQDHYRRNTDHKLPVAKIAFVDEVFKSSSALLNTLLPILNERIFFNNGDPIDLPLRAAFFASNEAPRAGDELGALWDRIAFRLHVKRIQNQGNRDTMLKAAAARKLSHRVELEPVISWDELMSAADEVKDVAISQDVYDALNGLCDQLFRENIFPSDRRLVECIPIIQANAYRAGRTEADIEDMRLLAHVLWNDFKEQPIVQRMVYELANPLDKVAMEMMDDVEGLATQVDAILKDHDNSQERNRKAIEVHGKLEEAAADLAKLRKQAKAEGRKSEIMEPLRQRILGLTRKLLQEVFTIDESGLQDD
jgi:MoxR-like ATPase